ncbi:MAG: DUF3617 domain-containing protein [Steroidobacteraceae bacterium]
MNWLCRVASAASVLLLVLAPARAAEEPGILWETTSQSVMEMQGNPMQMPPQTSRMCAAQEWKQPPAGGGQECVTTNFIVVGNKATWAVQCSGQMTMTGTGEMTFSGDSYTGLIKFLVAEMGMNMTVRLSGRKVGTCDNPQ